MSSLEETFKRVVEHIDPDEIADLTLKFVEIPSETLREFEGSRFYAKVLEEAGLEVRMDYTVSQNRPNVIGRLPGVGGGRNLLLCGHIDTIPLGSCVKPKIEGGRIYGRGAFDQKGPLIAAAMAAKAVASSGVKLMGDLGVVGYVDHELPHGVGAGAKALAEAIAKGEVKADAAVQVGGRLDAIQIAHGGMGVFTIKVHGPKYSYHSTQAPLKMNPILWTADLIGELHDIDQGLRRQSHPLIEGSPHLQLGLLSGGDFYNRVPRVVEVVGNIRWNPSTTYEEVKGMLEARLTRLEQRIQHLYDSSARLSLELQLGREACEIPRDEEIVKRLQRVGKMILGKEIGVYGSRAVSDLSITVKIGGIPHIGYGAASNIMVGTAHSDNESVEIEALEKLAKILSILALDFCSISP